MDVYGSDKQVDQEKILKTRVIENNTDSAEEYLGYLNQCFPGWGDVALYNWVFDRDVGAGRADRIFAYHENEIIGGTGVSYRMITDSKGAKERIAIMTGSWTLPAARGKGCFSHLILAMRDQAIKKGCVLLTAFAFKDNASYGAMLRQNCVALPTVYVRDPLVPTKDCQSDNEFLGRYPVSDKFVEELFVSLQKSENDKVRFTYSLSEWKGQFIGDPAKMGAVSIGHSSKFIFEIANGFLRVLAMYVSEEDNLKSVFANILQITRKEGFRLFMFSTDSKEIEVMKELELEIIEGGFFLLFADKDRYRNWRSLDANHVLKESDLLALENSAYIGNWSIQNRDRI